MAVLWTDEEGLAAIINNNTGTDAGKVFRAKKQTGETTTFQVEEDGTVTVYGQLTRDAAIGLRNTQAGAGDMASFRKGGTEVLVGSYTGGGRVQLKTLAVTGANVTLKSAADVDFVVDHDDTGSTSAFYVEDSNGNAAFKLNLAGTVEAGAAGTVRWKISYSGNDTQLDIGLNNQRGRLVIYKGSEGGAGECSVLRLEAEDGDLGYLNVSTSGVLHLATGDPADGDGVGDKVSDQT